MTTFHVYEPELNCEKTIFIKLPIKSCHRHYICLNQENKTVYFILHNGIANGKRLHLTIKSKGTFFTFYYFILFFSRCKAFWNAKKKCNNITLSCRSLWRVNIPINIPFLNFFRKGIYFPMGCQAFSKHSPCNMYNNCLLHKICYFLKK